MKTRFIFLFAVMAIGAVPVSHAQSNFNIGDYGSFLRANRDLSAGTLLSRHAPQTDYLKSPSPVLTGGYAWLDSVEIKYGLSAPEKELLLRNGFAVTERLSFPTMDQAFHDIYGKDLPVFVSTDAILQAIHDSYDRILRDLELEIMQPNLIKFLDALYTSYPELVQRYGENPAMRDALGDVDLYVTMAKSLLGDRPLAPQYLPATQFDTVWQAARAEQLAHLPLFSERTRRLDFSQFTVRGHYAIPLYKEVLPAYFRSMMWLGRMDFLLTPPPASDEAPWGREEIRRMNLGAVLLHELVEISGARHLLEENDQITTFMVGESDNLTPAELAAVMTAQNITGADALLDDTLFDSFQAALLATPGSGQRILSDFFMVDPYAENPDPLPVSFRLMGQRFIVDSYILSNVVYDKIIYNGKKVWRPMPDPLDALFVLGNDDALPLLQRQLDTYHYASQLADLRYLVDSWDEEFWGKSLYNTWLSAIRTLNPSGNTASLPYFMRTAAWRQEKMNTQLASWAELRHDNLLYAKQSYTGGTYCSYPHSFVEPNPDFYHRIALFAERAGTFFGGFPSKSWRFSRIRGYFPGLGETMNRLETLSCKELNREPFTAEEEEYLKRMLFKEEGSGKPPFSGWYADLLYEQDPRIMYTVADVHTQPTDEPGNVVGNVLHAGVGKVNLGIFLADAPSRGYQPVAFVGPVMSYYEKVTENFDRLTDERWTALVNEGGLPPRPDWVNIYLADGKGDAFAAGRELPGILPTGVGEENEPVPQQIRLLSVNPNPFNPSTVITYTVPAAGTVSLIIYDVLGRRVETLVTGNHAAGTWSAHWNAGNAASGVYFCRLKTGAREETAKMLLVR